MNNQKRTAAGLGVMGLILIVIGIKLIPGVFPLTESGPSLGNQPALLFFNEDEPCDCMVELTQQANQQMAEWPVDRRGGLPVIRIDMESHKDLEARYKVFRAPCLVLVDDQDQVIWRQDYPLIEGGPFKLEEAEAAIATLGQDK